MLARVIEEYNINMKPPEFKSSSKIGSPEQEGFRKKLLELHELAENTTDAELAEHLGIKDDREVEYGVPEDPEYPKTPLDFKGFVRNQGVNFAEFVLDGKTIRFLCIEIDRFVKRLKRIHDHWDVSEEEKEILRGAIVKLEEVSRAWQKGGLSKDDRRIKELVNSGKSMHIPSDKEFLELMEAIETEQSINARINPDSQKPNKEKGGEDDEQLV